MRKLMTLTTEEKNTAALLAASCMFLSILEYLIPKPLPFMRVGLANLPILLSLALLPVRGTALVVILKVLGQGLINGTLFSYIFVFSAAGSFTSGIVMILVFQLCGRYISMTGVSVLGALSSNMVQIAAAAYFIFGKAAFLIAPPFLILGTVSAVVLGVAAEEFLRKSEWITVRKKAMNKYKAGNNEK